MLIVGTFVVTFAAILKFVHILTYTALKFHSQYYQISTRRVIYKNISDKIGENKMRYVNKNASN